MRLTDIRPLLAVACVAGALSMAAGGAKAQSAEEQICAGIDPDDVLLTADAISYAPVPWLYWCGTLVGYLIEWSIPILYELDLTDVHPSTISASLDREVPTATALLANDFLEFSDADGWYSSKYRWQTTCAGTTCRETHPTTGRVTTTNLRTQKFSGRGIQWTPFGEKDGVTVVKRESRQRHTASGTNYDWTRFGGWASDSLFFSGWREGVSGRYAGYGGAYSYSAGRASIGNPVAVTARWSGFMTGVDVGSPYTRGNPVLGRADVMFDNRRGQATVDVAFTDILDVKTLDERSNMFWNNLPVRNGSFRSGVDSHSIQGRFYGSRHQEVGGVFERNRISGAFGATRQ